MCEKPFNRISLSMFPHFSLEVAVTKWWGSRYPGRYVRIWPFVTFRKTIVWTWCWMRPHPLYGFNMHRFLSLWDYETTCPMSTTCLIPPLPTFFVFCSCFLFVTFYVLMVAFPDMSSYLNMVPVDVLYLPPIF